MAVIVPMYCSCQKVKRIFTKTIVENLPGIQSISKLLHVEKVHCVKMYTLPMECMGEIGETFLWVKVLAICTHASHFEMHDSKLTECFRKRLNCLTNLNPVSSIYNICRCRCTSTAYSSFFLGSTELRTGHANADTNVN